MDQYTTHNITMERTWAAREMLKVSIQLIILFYKGEITEAQYRGALQTVSEMFTAYVTEMERHYTASGS